LIGGDSKNTIPDMKNWMKHSFVAGKDEKIRVGVQYDDFQAEFDVEDLWAVSSVGILQLWFESFASIHDQK
jgi:hypothetical protein